jgi:plastocyanin domain-containing protein
MIFRKIALLALVIMIGCAAKEEPLPAGSGRRIDVKVTENGFEPDKISVQKDEQVTLVFTRKTDSTCAKQVLFDPGDGKPINQDLPLDKPVPISVKFPKTGEVRYACDMNMIAGVITVQ